MDSLVLNFLNSQDINLINHNEELNFFNKEIDDELINNMASKELNKKNFVENLISKVNSNNLNYNFILKK